MRLSAPIHALKRRAKILARDQQIPLNEALDRLARQEGFATWSLLASRLAKSPSEEMLARLSGGDMLLLGARPGHGKTKLGLQLLLDAAEQGRQAVFFTLEYSAREARERIRNLEQSGGGRGDRPEIVASDDISADSIIAHLSGSPRESVAIIDYLQILDQRRTKPALADQMFALRDFARRTKVVLGFISQIDRSFDPALKLVPDIRDIRLPNPIDVGIFSKTCFLHQGQAGLQGMG